MLDPIWVRRVASCVIGLCGVSSCWADPQASEPVQEVVSVPSAVAPVPQTKSSPESRAGWSGELDGAFSFNRSTYTTRTMSISMDVVRPLRHAELDGELRYDHESIVVENTPAQVEKDRYDANLKYKHFWVDSPYYTYVSPRVRADRFGFYQRARGLRCRGFRSYALALLHSELSCFQRPSPISRRACSIWRSRVKVGSQERSVSAARRHAASVRVLLGITETPAQAEPCGLRP